LKQLPSVEPEIDKCIECGYCEPKCASRDLTLTPRQRIVVRREMARLRGSANGNRKRASSNGDDDRAEASDLYAALDREFPYMALDTCATDGLCATACPVSIDTGQLVKRFRNLRSSVGAHAWAARIAENFALTERFLRLALRLGHLGQKLIGVEGMRSITQVMKRFAGENLSQWTADIPFAAGPVPKMQKARAAAVYFPACISRVMGRLPGEPEERSLMEVMVDLASRAGAPVYIPHDVAGTCCGTPFSSKGFTRAHTLTVNHAVEKFWRWSERGRLPIVVDTSPCTYGFRNARPWLSEENQTRFDRIKFLDAIEFVHDELLPKLSIKTKSRSVALHPVCSVTKMGIAGKLEAIARACSDEVTVPSEAGCCGFAGDRGFLVPELTASATRGEAAQVRAAHAEECYSSSRTCEIGMSRATGQIYRSYMYLLEKATR
jgi:D-lactate dehydrogenase